MLIYIKETDKQAVHWDAGTGESDYTGSDGGN